jgi:predicted MFS family arabinose efflux permease
MYLMEFEVLPAQATSSGRLFLTSLGGFSFGYDQWVISIINVMDRFHAVFPRTDTAFGKGLMTGVLLLRSFIGGLFMPYLADRISRKWALTVVVVIFDVSAVIQTCAQNYSTLMVGRTNWRYWGWDTSNGTYMKFSPLD